MKNILFCCEKWCDANPSSGLTNNFHNLINSFNQNVSGYISHVLHLDECAIIYGRDINELLLGYCKSLNIDIIVFSLLGESSLNPSINTFKLLKDSGVKICVMWPDTSNWAISEIMSLSDSIDLSVSWDTPQSEYHSSVSFPNNHIFLWVPQDLEMFRKVDQDIDVSFIGSTTYPDRRYFLKNLSNVFIAGNQRIGKLTQYEYSSFIRRSRINLNFCISPCQRYYQTKGRVYEVMASSSLLLEHKNSTAKNKFKPGYDYVEFDTADNLKNLINHFISNESDRLSIASNGYNSYMSKYSPKIFWNTVLERLI